MKFSGIYKIKNIINDNCYIGSSINIKNRTRIHKRYLLQNKHHSIILQRAYNKYKKENFVYEIIEIIDNKKELIKKEQYWIDKIKPIYNICKKANSSLGIKRRKETIEKLKISHLGNKHTKESKKKIGDSQRGNKHWTKNKFFSKEAKKHMSEGQINLYKNGYISPLKGKKLSKERIEKYKNKRYKKIIQINIFNWEKIKEWKSASIAGKILDINKGNITSCCRNKRKTAGGFKWQYAS